MFGFKFFTDFSMGCDNSLRLQNMSVISFSPQGLGILGDDESELWVVMGYKMC